MTRRFWIEGFIFACVITTAIAGVAFLVTTYLPLVLQVLSIPATAALAIWATVKVADWRLEG